VFSQSYYYETYVVQYSTRQSLCKYNVEIFMETSRRNGPDASKRQIGHRSSATCLHMASSTTSESRKSLPCDTVSTYIWTREPWIAVSQIPRAAYFGLNVFVPSALHTYTLSLLPPFDLDLYGICGLILTGSNSLRALHFRGSGRQFNVPIHLNVMSLRNSKSYNIVK
jgi:hypothetical protein